MTRLKDFTAVNPTGTNPGMEPVDFALLKAAVANKPMQPQPAAPLVPEPTPAPLPQPTAAPALIAKNLRLPADLVDFIDYTFTKERRMKKQDAYTLALEAFFRPLMAKASPSDAAAPNVHVMTPKSLS